MRHICGDACSWQLMLRTAVADPAESARPALTLVFTVAEIMLEG
jgi:hypothetical protein